MRVREFAAALSEETPNGSRVTIWRGGRRASAHLLEYSLTTQTLLLYVKEFNVAGKPGFWGLTRNQIARLEAAGSAWYAVLLLRSATSGFLVPDVEVRVAVQSGAFELSRDGDYKINEARDLTSRHRFANLEALAKKLAGGLGGRAGYAGG